MTALAEPTVKVRAHKQSAAERQAVYDDVTARDKRCRAWAIVGPLGERGDIDIGNCGDRLGRRPYSTERHHAGNTIGSKRITDARHVVLLCEWHHAHWAPTHSRLILEWLARIEDAREAQR